MEDVYWLSDRHNPQVNNLLLYVGEAPIRQRENLPRDQEMDKIRRYLSLFTPEQLTRALFVLCLTAVDHALTMNDLYDEPVQTNGKEMLIAEALVDLGANPSARNYQGLLPEDLAKDPLGMDTLLTIFVRQLRTNIEEQRLWQLRLRRREPYFT